VTLGNKTEKDMKMRAMLVMVLGVVMLFAVSGIRVFAADTPENAMQELQSLAESAQKAHEAKDFKKAISLFEKILAARPNPIIEYNLACAYAQSDDSDKALLHLERAVDLGFIDAGHIEKDSDLVTVRKFPNYTKILQKARTLVEAQQKALASIPAPQDIVLTVKDLKQGEKSPLLIFLHGMWSSPGELKSAFEPLTTTWKHTVFLPSGSVKLGMKPDGKPAYSWDPIKDVQVIVEKIKKMQDVDPKRIYLGGFSAGASMAYIVALDSPELFAGVIGFSGAIQKELLTDEKVKKAAGKVPLYIVHGKQDQMMPISLGRDALDYFKKNGFRVTLTEFEGTHTLPGNYFDMLKEAVQWFHTESKTE